MIRLSPPGHGRVEFSPMLEVCVGGGEYNVSYALARLGLRTGWIGGLNNSPAGNIFLTSAAHAGGGGEGRGRPPVRGGGAGGGARRAAARAWCAPDPNRAPAAPPARRRAATRP